MTTRREGESSREWIDRVGAVGALCELLEEADMRVTFDPERSISKPCFVCGCNNAPRELVRVASWCVDLGCWERGDAVSRPVCGKCCMRLLPQAMRAATDAP